MFYEFKFPDVGEGIAEGEIVKWHVKPGEVIEEDQLLAEVQTDKAIVEISSPVGGVVAEIRYNEGESVKVGSVWVTINTKNEARAQTADLQTVDLQSAQTKQSHSKSSTAPVTSKYLPLAVPTVRRLAREFNVDLTLLKGTGKDGRITEQDVRDFVNAKQNVESTVKNPEERLENESSIVEVMAERLIEPNVEPKVDPKVDRVADRTIEPRMEADERVPLRGIRKQIAHNMMKSMTMTAQSTVMDEVNLTALVALKEKMAEKAMEKGVTLTYLPFFIKAAIHALQQYPYLNASLDTDTQEIVLKKRYNIGIAVDTSAGLMVPVIKHANSKNLLQLAEELSSLAEKARQNKLSLENFKDGTFTISNIGSTRAVQFGTPILNYPEVAILAINKIHKKPIVVDDQIAIAHVMGIGLTFDHQVIDGVMAANFLKTVIELLEQPDLLFLMM